MSVEAFEAAVAQHLGAIHETARESPPGGGPAWDRLLSHYGVAGVGAEERRAVATLMRVPRGATPGEVRLLLDALVRWADGELARLAADPRTATDDRISSWRGRLQGLAQAEVQRYEAAIGYAPSPAPTALPPSAAPAIASIFANAQKTSKEVPWAGMKTEQAHVLTCVHCGGPQETQKDFMCRYCRRPIAGKIERTS